MNTNEWWNNLTSGIPRSQYHLLLVELKHRLGMDPVETVTWDRVTEFRKVVGDKYRFPAIQTQEIPLV